MFKETFLKSLDAALADGTLSRSQWRLLRMASRNDRFMARAEAHALDLGIAEGTMFADSVGARDWSAFAEFIKAILPLILQLLPLFI